MIIVRIKGGLGNQMFQYAFGHALAARTNRLLKLDISAYEESAARRFLLDQFNCRFEVASPGEIHSVRSAGPLANALRRLLGKGSGVSRRCYFEQDFSFDPSVYDIGGNSYFDGYWQSEKYFESERDTLRKQFLKPPGPSSPMLEYSALQGGCTAIAIHVRRGDYVSSPEASQVHGTCSPEYYEMAIDYIKGQTDTPRYFFFSDDIEWVRQQFSGLDSAIFVDLRGVADECDELMLMANCQHHIIANSSFSWWGAWLNRNPEKVVIAPRRWFRDESVDTSDLFPAGWVAL